MKPEETIDFHLRWAWHKTARLYNLAAQEHGFTMSMGYTLLNIDKYEGTPSTKLGPLMGMESRSLTRTLKTMEESGFIERKSDPTDKRMVRVFLTEKGMEARKISRATVIRFNERIQDVLTTQEREQFFQIMKKVNQRLDETQLVESETIDE